MSENSTPEERTEMPTDRRMGQIRKEGAMHMSSEVVTTVTLFAGFITLSWLVTSLFSDMKLVVITCFKYITQLKQFSYKEIETLCISVMGLITPDVMLLVCIVAAVGVFSVMLQTDWNVKERKFHFDMGKLNPIQGIKRIFSIMGFVNVIKSLIKLGLILPIAYFALKHFAPEMISMIHLNIEGVLSFTGDSIRYLFWKIFYVLFVLSVFDYFWTKFQWLKNNKMTKQEVKEEKKAVEGDEETKRKIIAKGLQRIAQRLRESVPRADVVVTNPTHFAVALKYDRATMSAPIVVAKGADFLAKQIREIAKEHKIPILERKVLARALYSSTEVGTQIPYELFKAVAEVLAYVFRLKNPYAAASQPTK